MVIPSFSSRSKPRYHARWSCASALVMACLLSFGGPTQAGLAQEPGGGAAPSPFGEDWPGYDLGLEPASYRVVGRYDGMAPSEEELEALQARVEGMGPESGGAGTSTMDKALSFFAFHHPSRTVYEVTVDRNDARRVGRHLDRREPANAGSPDPRAPGGARAIAPLPGLSGSDLLGAAVDGDEADSLGLGKGAETQVVIGSDERVRFTNTTYFPYRAIGNEGGCTGTQVGPRHVVTSAHCMVKYGSQSDPNDPNSANWYMTRYIPGRDGDIMPYGVIQPVWYFVPSGFLLGTGGYTSDWGVMTLPKSYAQDYPTAGIGWFDMVNAPIDALKKLTVYNRGYPLCGASGPVGCAFRTLWGKPSAKIVGTYKNSSQMLLHDSDTSGGHSGSGIFAGPWSQPRLLGIHKGPSDGDSDDFNWAVRLTQDRIDYIMYMRSVQK